MPAQYQEDFQNTPYTAGQVARVSENLFESLAASPRCRANIRSETRLSSITLRQLSIFSLIWLVIRRTRLYVENKVATVYAHVLLGDG